MCACFLLHFADISSDPPEISLTWMIFPLHFFHIRRLQWLDASTRLPESSWCLSDLPLHFQRQLSIIKTRGHDRGEHSGWLRALRPISLSTLFFFLPPEVTQIRLCSEAPKLEREVKGRAVLLLIKIQVYKSGDVSQVRAVNYCTAS